jgi:malate dehydrogenase (oxaloacetate-decarboxylating)(NADP+)
MQQKIRREDALDYHAKGGRANSKSYQRKNTAPSAIYRWPTHRAWPNPCLAIEANPDDAYTYTAKGNLVAVISNGTAVLGLGDIGPAASKPCNGRKGAAVQDLRRHRRIRR